MFLRRLFAVGGLSGLMVTYRVVAGPFVNLGMLTFLAEKYYNQEEVPCQRIVSTSGQQRVIALTRFCKKSISRRR